VKQISARKKGEERETLNLGSKKRKKRETKRSLLAGLKKENGQAPV